MELDIINEELDRLGGLDPSALADPESIVALHQVAARAESLATRATAAFDAAGDWAPDGARTASAWVTAKCRVKKGEARRRVRRGRELRFLPETTRAWAEGDITGAHVDVMISLRTRRPKLPSAGTRPCWSTRPGTSPLPSSPAPRPTGGSWPIRTGPTRTPTSSGAAVTSTWSRASAGTGSGP